SLMFAACSNQQKEQIRVIEINYQKDLIPEGMAVHPETGDIFLSSLHLKKIVKAGNEGQNAEDLIETGRYGFRSGVGMDVVNDKLFAISSSMEDHRGKSPVLVLNPHDGRLMKSFTYQDTARHFLNDLAVSSDERIFITDSDNHRVFKINDAGEFEVLVESEEIAWPNGITISGDDARLYIASWLYGIRVYDLVLRQFLNDRDTTGLTNAIDGMRYYNNTIVAVQNGFSDSTRHAVVQYFLSDNGNRIAGADTLAIHHPKMNVPTTLDIVNGQVYVIANSQLHNINQPENKIIDPALLEPTYILKIDLK
ncbi:MAG: SMP-30/gluconolactonase/LRE family protein, partial [Bacteroidota bacterium]